jgi:hypothetical protein
MGKDKPDDNTNYCDTATSDGEREMNLHLVMISESTLKRKYQV